jgi:coenzyme PQQ synthesis protein D (PqqD)
MTHMTRYASVALSADVIFRDLEGDAVLLDLASGRYFGLNPVGTRMWTLLAAGATVDAAIAALAAEFDAEAGQISRDVEALLTEMATRVLVTVVPAPPGSRP